MIKLNNKGFAVSTILYGILALTILILMLIFGIMRASKDMNEDLVESLETNLNKCALSEAELESCYFDSESCYEERYLYYVCLDKNMTLAEQILSDNMPYADNVASIYVTSSTGINFSKVNYYTAYDQVISSTTSSINRTNYFTGDSLEDVFGDEYYYGKGYTFDESTGNYTLTDTVHLEWNRNTYKTYPYMCEGSGESTCSVLYKMTGYTDSTHGTGYKYTSELKEKSNGKGLYYTSKGTENNKITYYFRGDVENNYVDFAGHIWRIVRINEDNSVRLIKESIIGSGHYNYVDGGVDNAYLGYMYGTAGSTSYSSAHANTNDSEIKKAIDEWYELNLSSYSSYLADAGFCNDRAIHNGVGYGTNLTKYGAYDRLYNNNSPKFGCTQTNDLFTTSTSNKGNKALDYPIGLLTLDEVVYAGGVVTKNGITSYNTNYYLHNGQYWWTMTPTGVYNSYNDNRIGLPTGDGRVNYGHTYHGNGFRPVINLKSNVEVAGGFGTESEPYVIRIG